MFFEVSTLKKATASILGPWVRLKGGGIPLILAV